MGSGFLAQNAGPTRMDSGLRVAAPAGTLDVIRQKQKDGELPFFCGVHIEAPAYYGVIVSGAVAQAAISLQSADGGAKVIEWVGGAGGSRIYCHPPSGDFVIEPTGNINLSSKGTIQQSGLSGTSVPAKNLRGIGVFVTGDALTKPIDFAAQELDVSYSILVQCDWQTTAIVQNRTIYGFTVNFGTAAPHSGGHLDWLLLR
jgi:hypothetical protein